MADWRHAIRGVISQVHPNLGCEGALAKINDDLNLLLDAVVEELRLSTTERVSVAAVEKAVGRGLEGELLKHALSEMAKARSNKKTNSGLKFDIGQVRALLVPKLAGRRVQRGVCASLAALIEYVCEEVLELGGGRCDVKNLIESSHIEAAIRGDQELDLLFHPNGGAPDVGAATSRLAAAIAATAKDGLPGIGRDRFRALASDKDGNLYLVDHREHRIRKVTPSGEVSTLAGGEEGFADGIGVAAKFKNPRGIAVDMDCILYVADTGNHRIRKVAQNGVVSTLAGGGEQGFADGIGDAAKFDAPHGIAVDVDCNVYVSDYGNNRIRKVAPPDGAVSTLAGGERGFADGIGVTAAKFDAPHGIAVDEGGVLFVADSGNNRIRKVMPDGHVCTLAGGKFGFADGSGCVAQFKIPHSVAIDATGSLYVADGGNDCIRKVTPDGVVSTWARITNCSEVSVQCGKMHVLDGYISAQVKMLDLTLHSKLEAALASFGCPDSLHELSAEDLSSLEAHLQRTVIDPVAEDSPGTALAARRALRTLIYGKEAWIPRGVDAHDAQDAARLSFNQRLNLALKELGKIEARGSLVSTEEHWVKLKKEHWVKRAKAALSTSYVEPAKLAALTAEAPLGLSLPKIWKQLAQSTDDFPPRRRVEFPNGWLHRVGFETVRPQPALAPHGDDSPYCCG